jgi:hypothetical protein
VDFRQLLRTAMKAGDCNRVVTATGSSRERQRTNSAREAVIGSRSRR